MRAPPHPLLCGVFAAASMFTACVNPGHPPEDNPGEERTAVARVLDDFHNAAATADEARYLGHFAPEGVFLGTDASERWPLEEFRRFVHPYFSKGTGWTYVARDRNVIVFRDFAWFDEIVTNEHYGELRGSGALRRIGGRWKLLQYNLAFLIPNDHAKKVVELIRPKPD